LSELKLRPTKMRDEEGADASLSLSELKLRPTKMRDRRDEGTKRQVDKMWQHLKLRMSPKEK